MIRVAVLAPIRTSLYSRLVVHLSSIEPGVKVVAVLVRTPWTLARVTGELRRDGGRLLWKAYRKLVLRERAYDDPAETIYAMARRVNLPGRSLGDLSAAEGFRLAVVKDHNDQTAQRILRDAQPDLVAFTGGGLIRPEVLRIPRIGVLNCHLGLLPRYRGMDVVEWPFVEHDSSDPPAVDREAHR
ncbi:MAG: hypothetical protein NUV77_21400, partial [Thermoguttaceae bacterium]|nr:hypothetical protein [Thermoguttaceae bacterium]